MDAIVKVTRQKKNPILGRESFLRTMKDILDNNQIVCIYGPTGVGKTHAVKKALEDVSFIELTVDSLNNLDVIAESTSHILIDDIDTEAYTWTSLVSRGKLSKGSTIYITNNIKGVESFDCINLEPLDTRYQIQLARERFPTVDPSDAIRRANGNLKNMFSYLDGWDHKDVFMSPKDVIHDMLCKSDLDLNEYIGRTVEEHGYSVGIIHENYTDARDIDTVSISQELSMADVYDNTIYRGSWELLPYYCHHGIVTPALAIDHGLLREVIRPGSSWTKFNNYKMRSNKVSTILRRCQDLTVDKLHLIREKCLKEPDDAVKTLLHYGMIPQDLDVINHLGFATKIKPKAVKKLKNALGKQSGR